jgi:hypothetical protein
MCHVYRKKHAIITPHSWALLGESARLLSENPSRVAFTPRDTLSADVKESREFVQEMDLEVQCMVT